MDCFEVTRTHAGRSLVAFLCLTIVFLAPIKAWTEENPNQPNPRQLFDQARSVSRSGDHEKAIQIYSDILKVMPGNAVVLASRAQEYKRLKKYDLSLQDATAAIAADPKRTAYYVNRSDLYLRMEKYQQAFDDATQAIQSNDKSASAYCNRGAASLQLGNVKAALKDLNRAISIDAKLWNGEPFYYRSRAYEKLGDAKHSLEDKKQSESLGYKPGALYVGNTPPTTSK